MTRFFVCHRCQFEYDRHKVSGLRFVMVYELQGDCFWTRIRTKSVDNLEIPDDDKTRGTYRAY